MIIDDFYSNIEKDYNATVLKVLEIDDIYVLLLGRKQNIRFNNNVVAINKNGTILWQIEEVGFHDISPYTNIFIDEDNRLQAYNWIGMEYFVDITNGKITRAREGRLW